MKYRLDMFLVMKGLITSRQKAKEAITSGQVFVNGKSATPSTKVEGNEEITLGNILPYVSRGALKLEKATEVFNINFNNRIVLDIGSSTGGFSEIALLNGAKNVIAVDVGKNQLHERLKSNPKLTSFEGQDFRSIDNKIIKDADLVVSDVSFISLSHIFPKIIEALGTKVECVILFKPQFECGPVLAKRYAGVIRDKKIHTELLLGFERYITSLGFKFSGIDYSPITGKEGNIEYIIHLNGENKKYNILKTIDKAFENL